MSALANRISHENANKLIARLQLIPHLFGGEDFDGADCWGIVILWYKELGIQLKTGLEEDFRACNELDRPQTKKRRDAVKQFIVDGDFYNQPDWYEVSTPQNHDVILMSDGKRKYAHIGVYWNGYIIHSNHDAGCVYQSARHPIIFPLITGIFRHHKID